MIIGDVKNTVRVLMSRLHFPCEAIEVFESSLEQIFKDEAARETLIGLMAQYDETEKCDYKQMLEDMKKLGQKFAIHEYTSAMLLFLCLAEKLRLRYAERGIDEAVFYQSMADLRYKLEECRLVKGVVGTFVAEWFTLFFNLTCFSIGRLEFEISALPMDCKVDGLFLPAGSKALSVHIPRTGERLTHSLVLDSYRQAAAFFKDEFQGVPLIFMCSSWLLDPWNMTVLAPDSNLAAFYKDFNIVASGQADDYNDVWRLFDCAYEGDPDKLPQNTSLRRAYVKRMKKGEPLGWGCGVFLYKEKASTSGEGER